MRLYDYWRSSSAYRVRIALRLKGIDYSQAPVNLRQGCPAHAGLSRPQPAGLGAGAGHRRAHAHPVAGDHRVAGRDAPGAAAAAGDADARAVVRSLALHVACEIHPLNNLRVLQYLEASAGPGGARRQRLVPTLDRRGPGLARAPARGHRRHLLLRRHGHPGRSVPGAAGLQCAPLQLRPDAVPDHRADRRGLPEAAGFRRGAAGAAAGRRLKPAQPPALASASAAASKGSRTHSWRLLTAWTGRTWPARPSGRIASPARRPRISPSPAARSSADAPTKW